MELPSYKSTKSSGPSKQRKTINAYTECYRRKQKCDRKQPCGNCVSRNVTLQCRYSQPRIPSNGSGDTEETTGARTAQAPTPPHGAPDLSLAVEPQEADLGYSFTAGSNALVDFEQLLQKENEVHINSTAHHHSFQRPEVFITPSVADARLPSRMAINKLVEIFFDDVNWQYFILEKQYFDSLAICWFEKNVETVPHLSHEELERELNYFPVLLFQVLGLAIQFLPLKSPVWGLLSQADIALCQKYSDIGVELMTCLRRGNVALATVQADFLRALWLKAIGKGVEAWCSVGNAIRSAQKLELHRHKDTDKQGSSSPMITVSRIWYEEYKRRLWMNLCIWDTLSSMILGRPRAIHPDDCDVEDPIECNIPQYPSTCVPGPREVVAERDRPNTVSSNLFMYRLSNVWHAVKALKADRPYLDHYSVVRQLHDQVNRIRDQLPPTLRYEHPDLSWDSQYPYLRQQREDILTKANQLLMALHRPHIKHQAESRRAALQAAIVILDSQHRSFMMARPHQYKSFGLSFYTIDASLLLSVIAVKHLSPMDSEFQAKIDYVLHQAMNRLSAMRQYSPIARSGLSILKQCYQVLKTRLEFNTATLTLPKTTAHDLKNVGQQIEVDVGNHNLSEQRPPLPHQQYQQHNQQEWTPCAPMILPTGYSTSRLQTSNELNSLQNDWISDISADAELVPTTAIQASLYLGPSTTDFDETYWLTMINEIPHVLDTDLTDAVEMGGTVDTSTMGNDTVWNPSQVFSSIT